MDGLRTVLALAVVGYHLGVPGMQAGILAVPAFFALSGLLITDVVLDRLRVTGHLDLRAFLLDRALRIVPPVIIVVVVVGCLWSIVGRGEQTSSFAAVAGAALTGTTNLLRTHTDFRAGPLEPLWSVAAEWQFYLLWPLLLIAVATSGRGRRLLSWVLPVVVVGLVAVSASVGVTGTPESAPPAYYSVTLSFACSLLGALGSLVVDRAGPRAATPRAGRALTWFGAGSTLALVLAVPPDWKTEPWVPLVVLPLTAAAVTVFAIGLRSARTIVGRALAAGPLAWFGRNASYSLYLWHLPVYTLLLPSIDGLVGRAVMGVTAIGVALVSAVVIERPVGRLRRRLTARWPGRTAPAPTPYPPQ